jgi:VanZ family protein
MKIILSIALILAAFVISTIQNSDKIKVAFDTLLAHDKLIHAVGSQLLFVAFYMVFPNEKAVCAAVLCVGLGIEIAQHFTGRGFSIGDLIADLAGVVLCVLIRKM